MARVVSICEKDNYDFQSRQVLIEVDNVKMVVQFSDKCVDCGKLCRARQKELDHFANKFRTLTKDELSVALLVPGKDLLNLLPLVMPCVGCRKSVERLFCQLQKSQHRALEPLIITPLGELSIQHEYLLDPRSLFSLFHIHGPKLYSVVEGLLKSKKNKRCNLHSLETHKSRTLGRWLDTWDALSDSCREKVLVVEMNQLMVTIDKYLEKHKFCTECKSKVMLAYNICVGQHDGSSEEGYCAALFENLRCCAREQHIHVLNDIDFIADLLDKAEPAFIGGKREQHAKTLDIAQEEILTCLGIHIFDRLHRISQKLRSEEQTWLILLHMGVDVLRKSYQAALEIKQGSSELELFCEKLEEKEKRQGARQEMKKQKRKQKKDKMATKNVCKLPEESLGVDNACLCSNVGSDIKNLHNDHHRCKGKCRDANFNSLTLPLRSSDPSLQDPQYYGTENKGLGAASKDSCQNCSTRSESSKKIKCSRPCTDSLGSCQSGVVITPSKAFRELQVQSSSSCCNHKITFQSSEQPSLQDLLDEVCCADGKDDDPGISEEEIIAFKTQQVDVESQRQKLRENLRQRFQDLYSSRHASTVE